MRILILILLLPSISFAKCFVAGNDPNYFIACAEGFKPAWHSKIVCESPKLNGDYVMAIEILDIAPNNCVVNPTKKAAYDAAQQAQKDAEQQELTKREQRIQQAHNAFTNWDTLTANQKDQVLKALLKDLLVRYAKEQE